MEKVIVHLNCQDLTLAQLLDFMNLPGEVSGVEEVIGFGNSQGCIC